MKTRFDAKLKAQVSVDDEDRVRAINYSDAPAMEAGSPRDAAVAYLKSAGKTLNIPANRLLHVNERVSHKEPHPQDVEYRIAQEKTLFDSTTVAFAQTINNLPIWGAETAVTVKHGPNRVISAVDTSHAAPQAPAPEPDAVDRFQQVFAVAEAEQKLRQSGLDPAIHMNAAVRAADARGEPLISRFVRDLLAGVGG